MTRKVLKVPGIWMEHAVEGGAKSHTRTAVRHTSLQGSCTVCSCPSKAWWQWPSPDCPSPDLHAARCAVTSRGAT